jgi:hypothetical protein
MKMGRGNYRNLLLPDLQNYLPLFYPFLGF